MKAHYRNETHRTVLESTMDFGKHDKSVKALLRSRRQNDRPHNKDRR